MSAGMPISARNGRLRADELARVRTGQPLSIATAQSYNRLDHAMRVAGQGALTLTAGLSGYRTLAEQQHLRNIGLTTIAVGRSVHGEGLAADFQQLGGMNGARYRWLVNRGRAFGWFHPTWATPGSPHHWEYNIRLDTHRAEVPPTPPEPEPPAESGFPWFIRRSDGLIVIVSRAGGVRGLTAAQWQTYTNLGMAGFEPGFSNMDPGPFAEVIASLGGMRG